MKGKTRKLVSLKSFTVGPAFHEEKDVSHVSLVATVTLGGQALTRLMLTTTGLPFKSEDWLSFPGHSQLIGPPAAT
jgi:hypothetical protein